MSPWACLQCSWAPVIIIRSCTRTCTIWASLSDVRRHNETPPRRGMEEMGRRTRQSHESHEEGLREGTQQHMQLNQPSRGWVMNYAHAHMRNSGWGSSVIPTGGGRCDATPHGSFSSPWTLKAPHYTAFFSNSLRRRRYRRFQLVLQLKPALIFIQWDTQRLQTRETSAAIRFDSASQTSITPAEAVRIISLGKLTRVRISWGASILHLFC